MATRILLRRPSTAVAQQEDVSDFIEYIIGFECGGCKVENIVGCTALMRCCLVVYRLALPGARTEARMLLIAMSEDYNL